MSCLDCTGLPSGGASSGIMSFVHFRGARNAHSLPLWIMFASGVAALYALSFYSVYYFVVQFEEQNLNPGTNIKFSNEDGVHPIRMPAIKLCGLSPYHNIGNPSCLFRDIGNRMHNQTCDIFKVPPDPSDPIDLPCYVFNSKGLFATKVASFSSGFEIAIELISVTPSGGAERPYNPFTDSNALTGYVYEPLTMTSDETSDMIIPVGQLSALAVQDFINEFPISGRNTRETYGSTVTHAPFRPGTASNATDLLGRVVANTAYVNVFFKSMTIQTTVEIVVYKWFNAFSDMTAVGGFLVGSCVWSGPSYAAWIWMDFLGRKPFTSA